MIGGDPKYNASELTALLYQVKKVHTESSTILNSAAAIYLSGKVENLETGIIKASNSIDNGFALSKLKKLINFSKEK